MNIPKTLNELTPASYNPRVITEKSFKGLKASIGEFGDLSGIVFNLATGNLVAGHQRVNALKADGAGLNILIDNDRHYIEHKGERFYVRFVNWDIKKERLANVTANNPKIQGQWSDNIGVVLDEIVVDASPLLVDLQIPDLCSSLGIKEEELTADEDDFDASTETVTTDIVQGDIFEIGEHRLMCGDSTMIDHVEKLMNGNKADLVFTDPPYRIETEGGCKGSIGAGLKKQGKDIEFISEFEPQSILGIIPAIFEINKINAYIFCNKDLLPEYLSWAVDAGVSFNVLVWKKPSAIPIGGSHRPDIEYLLLFRVNATFNSGLADVNYSRCLEYGREKGLHPTMKPIELIGNEIKISSNTKNIVVDFFMGSGSTMVASHQLKRKCYGMELDPKYCQVIINRMRKLDPNIVVKRNGEEYKS